MSDGDVVLHCGDCLQYMRGMEAGSVDAVITDPPYGIGFDYNLYDDDPENYETMMRSIVSETERVNSGMSFYWQAMQNAD